MRLFVGGWGGSGTRVIQYWLSYMNVFAGDRQTPPFNWALDYIPILDPFLMAMSSPQFLHDHLYMDAVRTKIEEDTQGTLNWSLKHGHLMFNPKFCQMLYPDCKFILVVRHGIDNVLNNCTLAEDFAHINPFPRPDFLENRIAFWSQMHLTAMSEAQHRFRRNFMILRLEDMVFRTEQILDKLAAFTGVDIKPGARKACMDFVTVPESIGRRLRTNGSNYDPMKNLDTLYAVGEEGLESLGYSPW